MSWRTTFDQWSMEDDILAMVHGRRHFIDDHGRRLLIIASSLNLVVEGLHCFTVSRLKFKKKTFIRGGYRRGQHNITSLLEIMFSCTYSLMQSDAWNSFCGDVVLDSLKKAWRMKDSNLEQIFAKQICLNLYCEYFKFV